jgi:putative oxygen-independent coproporphyrinogen III oxidase
MRFFALPRSGPSAETSQAGAAARPAALPERGFGVYIHWPFCLAKCPYCDFNSHVREAVDGARWRAALLAELDHWAQATRSETAAPGREVTSIFFGGGTPSLMAPETVAALIERVRARWPVADDLEITLEANPGAAETARLAAFAEAGVNRVSIGVQSLDDDALKFLGRIHGRTQAVAAVERAAALFPRFSFDLIYARPRQDETALRRELDNALALAGGHLSLYQLTIEPGTAFHTAHRLGDFAMPGEESAARLYEVANEVLEAAGLPAYEISNHARPGEASRHNLTYWRYGDYVGVGPGAHGRLTRAGGAKQATRQRRLPEAWLKAVEAEGHATEERVTLSPAERFEEMLMMGLRLREGVALAAIVEETGSSFADQVDATTLARLIDGGFLALDDEHLRATPAGRLRLNAVLGALLA